MLAKAFFSLSLFIFILPAAHAGIYRWVDEKGQTQFSDRPVDNKTQKVKVNTQHNSYGGGGVLERQKGLLDEYQAKDAQQLRNKKQAEKEAAQAQRLEARCINAKDRLKNFKKGRCIVWIKRVSVFIIQRKSAAKPLIIISKQ